MSSINLIENFSNVSVLNSAQKDSLTQNNAENTTINQGKTLEDDIVTINQNCSCDNEKQDQNEFSSSRSKARSAYLGIKQNNCPVHQNRENSSSENKINEDEKDKKTPTSQEPKKINGEALSESEQKKVQELKDRNQEVRNHELAHQRAGGALASAPSYEYENGPDGKKYAVAGHVNIDASEESTPEKTAQKMKTVIKAANAPAEPSSQDRKVAAEANSRLSEANAEIAKQNQQKQEEQLSGSKNNDTENKSEETKDISDNITPAITQGSL